MAYTCAASSMVIVKRREEEAITSLHILLFSVQSVAGNSVSKQGQQRKGQSPVLLRGGI